MLNYGCRAAQGKRVSLLVVKAWYMNGYEPVERYEVLQSVISNMIWLEDSFGLSRVWYIRDLGCPFVLFTAFDKDWDLMSQTCIYILIFIYICDDMNICYLFLYYDVHWFCFGLGIIHWACGRSTPPFTPFSPRCDCYWRPADCIVTCNSFKMCTCSSDWVL